MPWLRTGTNKTSPLLSRDRTAPRMRNIVVAKGVQKVFAGRGGRSYRDMEIWMAMVAAGIGGSPPPGDVGYKAKSAQREGGVRPIPLGCRLAGAGPLSR